MTRAMLSVDWDYFIPESNIQDWSHRESLLYLTTIWPTRCDWIDKTTTTGEHLTFWHDVRKRFPEMAQRITRTVEVSDSHAWIWPTLSSVQPDAIVLVDAHHDCWCPKEDRREQVGCDTWGWQYLNLYPRVKIYWMRAKWSHFPAPDEVSEDRVCIIESLDELPNDMEIWDVHACRSGCWTPPWHDAEFLEFVRASDLRIDTVQNGEWDPMSDRWTDEMQETCQQFAAQYEALREGRLKL